MDGVTISVAGRRPSEVRIRRCCSVVAVVSILIAPLSAWSAPARGGGTPGEGRGKPGNGRSESRGGNASDRLQSGRPQRDSDADRLSGPRAARQGQRGEGEQERGRGDERAAEGASAKRSASAGPGALQRAARAMTRGSKAERQAGRDTRDFTLAERALIEREVASNRDPQRAARDISEQRGLLKDLADKINDTGRRGDPARGRARQDLKRTLRTGAHQDKIHGPSLAENVAKVKEMHEALKGFGPDRIVVMERGGVFLGDVVKAIDTRLGEKVDRPISGVEDGLGAARTGIEKGEGYIHRLQELYDAGERKFAVVDFEMGGITSAGLHEAARDFLAAHPDAEVHSFWIRETAQTGVETAGPTVVAREGDRLVSHKFSVHFVMGDDNNLIIKGDDSKALHLFDDQGRITATMEPEGNQTTRQLMIDVLSGKRPLP